MKTCPLDSSADPEGRFCVGPACDRAWNEGNHGVRKGPCKLFAHLIDMTDLLTDLLGLDLTAFGQALAEREISRINSISTDQRPESPCSSSKAERIATLQLASEVVTGLCAESMPGRFSSPSLWHNDLHLGNIYVSDDDPTQITSLIDWQSQIIQALFCQVRFPEFFDLPESFEIPAPPPKRPDNLHEMDEDDRMLAEYEYKQSCMGKAYIAASGFKKSPVYKALHVPPYFEDFFERCGEACEEGVVPL